MLDRALKKKLGKGYRLCLSFHLKIWVHASFHLHANSRT